MQPSPTTVGAALRPTLPSPRGPRLSELVRELAGWTLPPRTATTNRPPDGWSLAWATL